MAQKKKKPPVRRGFGQYRITGWNGDKQMKKMANFRDRLLKACHGKGCDGFGSCPDMCDCNGPDLDLHTAMMWQLAKKLDCIAEDYDYDYWAIDYELALQAKTTLEDAVYCIDVSHSELLYLLDEIDSIRQFAQVSCQALSYHRSKYKSTWDLMMKVKDAMWIIHRKLINIKYNAEYALKAMQKLYDAELEAEAKKEGDK